MMQCNFRITIRKASHEGHFWSVPYGNPSDVYHTEVSLMTLPAGLQRLQKLSSMEPRSHMANLTMAYPRDRKPPGYGKAKTEIYSEDRTQVLSAAA